MAIVQALCNSFKTECLSGVHDLSSDVLKVALYDDSADLGPDTTVYTTTNEVSGDGYIAGGVAVTNQSVAIRNGVAYLDFDNVVFSGVTIRTRGALLYNETRENRAIAAFSFGQNFTFSGGNCILALPNPLTAMPLVNFR